MNQPDKRADNIPQHAFLITRLVPKRGLGTPPPLIREIGPEIFAQNRDWSPGLFRSISNYNIHEALEFILRKFLVGQ